MNIRMICLLAVLAFATPASAQSIFGDRFILNTGPCETNSGSGSPEGVYVGNVCDEWIDTATDAVYRKASGTNTNTGWIIRPRLNQPNAWTVGQIIQNTEPTLMLSDTDQGANLKHWRIDSQSGIVSLQTLNDAFAGVVTIATWNRTGDMAALGTLTIGSGATFGSGAVALVDATGKIPAINTTYVASMVSALTGTGALNAGSITSGFGNIDIGLDTFTGNTFIAGDAATAGGIRLIGPAASLRDIRLQTGTGIRWLLRTMNDAESGSNAGSNFNWYAFADDGVTPVGTVFSMTRATLAMAFGGATTTTGVMTASSGVLINGGTFAANKIYSDATSGVVIVGRAGSTYDLRIENAAGTPVFNVLAGTANVTMPNGTLNVTGAITGTAITGTTGNFSSTVNGIGGSATGQSGAAFVTRGVDDAFEWGHVNASGFVNTLGHNASGGNGYIALHGEAGTSVNTYRTRGNKASIIQSDLAGGVRFGTVGNASADNQTLVPTLTLSAAGALDIVGNAGTSNYVSQVTGWRVTAAGAADFRDVFTDAMHAKIFTSDLDAVTRGSQTIAKSFGVLSSSFTCPAAAATATLTINDAPEAANVRLFKVSDWVALRTYTRTDADSDGDLDLAIGDCVGQVSAYVDGAGTQSWTFTRGTGGSAGAMASSTVVTPGNIAIDYGVSGGGVAEINAIDGAEQVNAPYFQVKRFVTSPVSANFSVMSRFGNLCGITGTCPEWGLIAGSYAATNGTYFRASNSAFELHGIDLKLWDGSTNTIFMNHTTPSLAIGSPVPSAYGAGAGIWMGKDAGAYKFRVGDPAGAQFTWNGSTMTAAGWTLGASTLVGGNVTLFAAGSISVGTGNDVVWLDATNATYRLWIGGSTPGTAPFVVTKTGSMFASLGTIGGWSIGSDYIRDAAGVVGIRSTVTGGDDIRFYAGDATPGSAEFRVTEAGALNASNATLTGASGSVTIDSGGISVTPAAVCCGEANGYKFVHANGTQGLYSFEYASGQVIQLQSKWTGATASKFAEVAITAGSFPVSGTNEGTSIYMYAGGGIPSQILASAHLFYFQNSTSSFTNIGVQIDGGLRTGYTDVTGYTQSNFNLLGGGSVEAFGIVGGAATNMNFYKSAQVQRLAVIQSTQGGASSLGGRLLFYTKSDASSGADVSLAGFIESSVSGAGGGLVWGSPAGASCGAGCINAQQVRDDNVTLTDWIFDLHYDGATSSPFAKTSGPLYSLDDVRRVTETERRLPWMPSVVDFDARRGLGSMVTSMWEGQERQQVFLFDLSDKIRQLEREVERLKSGRQ